MGGYTTRRRVSRPPMNEVALAVILSSFEAYLVYGYTLYIYIIEINSSRVKNIIRQKKKIEMTLCHEKYL